jgi:hypothetical protein
VIDTNIVISAALKLDGLQRTVLLLAITKPAKLYVSDAIVAEIPEVLGRPEPKIRRGLRQHILDLIKNQSQTVKPSRSLQVARTPTTTSFWIAPTQRAPFWRPLARRCAGELLLLVRVIQSISHQPPDAETMTVDLLSDEMKTRLSSRSCWTAWSSAPACTA